MGRTYDTVSFLSDYGTTDEFVGVVKSVIRTIAPGPVVIDVTHDIPAHDIRAGGLALVRSVQYLAPGVILAVVDPGVGTERRAVAVEVAGGEGIFVGPDNGLLAAAVAMTGGAQRAVELTDPDLPPRRAGADLRRPRHLRSSRGPPLQRGRPDRPRPVRRPDLAPARHPPTQRDDRDRRLV